MIAAYGIMYVLYACLILKQKRRMAHNPANIIYHPPKGPNFFEPHEKTAGWDKSLIKWNRSRKRKRKGELYFIIHNLNQLFSRNLFRFPKMKFIYYVEVSGKKAFGTNQTRRDEIIPMLKRCTDQAKIAIPLKFPTKNKVEKKEPTPEEIRLKWQRKNGF